MKTRKHMLIPALALSIAALTAGTAFADDETAGKDRNDSADIQMMTNAKLSLADAIQAAVSAQGGMALSAAFESNGGQMTYEVELAAPDGTTTMVVIDADSGKVLKTQTDTSQDASEENDGGSEDNNGEGEAD